jgi:hypothetical protein
MARGSDGFDPLKWWLRSRDGIDDAVDKDIARSCATKDGYRSEAEARAHIAMNGMGWQALYVPLPLLRRVAPHAPRAHEI